jgi:hypothetical protein
MRDDRRPEAQTRMKWLLGGWIRGGEVEEEARLRMGADRHNHTAEPIAASPSKRGRSAAGSRNHTQRPTARR